jgi:hypothetical protein
MSCWARLPCGRRSTCARLKRARRRRERIRSRRTGCATGSSRRTRAKRRRAQTREAAARHCRRWNARSTLAHGPHRCSGHSASHHRGWNLPRCRSCAWRQRTGSPCLARRDGPTQAGLQILDVAGFVARSCHALGPVRVKGLRELRNVSRTRLRRCTRRITRVSGTRLQRVG